MPRILRSPGSKSFRLENVSVPNADGARCERGGHPRRPKARPALGLGRVKTLLHDADRRERTQATAVRSIWANFTSHSTRTHHDAMSGGSFFRRPMNRNGARQRPYHALTAA